MIKVATVFSGIGAIEHALKKINIDHEIVFACDNGERCLKISDKEIRDQLNSKSFNEQKYIIDNLYDKTGKENFVQKSYMSNYKLNVLDFHQDIKFLDGNQYKGQVDLFVGGSPCQSFSISGNRRGLEDTRGTLFYEFARLIREIQPKVFIYENVPGILSHDKGKTWDVISGIFDELGYKWRLHKLSAIDFGIPQNRKRIYVIGIREDLNIPPIDYIEKEDLSTLVANYLDDKVDNKYFHGEKGFKWITTPKNLQKRVSINSEIARTQAANQQFNWCGDMVFIECSDSKKYGEKTYLGKFNGKKGVARKMTPRECLRLMGFDDTFKITVPDQEMYRQSGNSIVVPVLENIIIEIMKTDVFKEETKC